MPSDDLKNRIEAINKRPLKNAPEEHIGGLRRKLQKQAEAKARHVVEPAGPVGVSGFPPSTGSGSNPETPVEDASVEKAPRSIFARAYSTFGGALEDGAVVALEEVVHGIATPAPTGPDYYHIELAAVDLDECALEVHANFLPLIGHPEGNAVDRIAALCKSERIAPEEALFLDIETTGLGNTPVFLIGTMECDSDGFMFRQYFARDYSEEMSILSAFSQRLADARMLVTFNGKSFDMSYLRNRAVATGVKLPHPNSHLDLLHEARRAFGRTVPNHKLQTLEQIVCGKCREQDIPGAEIPAAYHQFVRTGNARKIGLILQHNLYDLLTMADLMGRMWGRL